MTDREDLHPVPGYGNSTCVTKSGRVWNRRKAAFIEPKVDRRGYRYVRLNRTKDGANHFRSFGVHELVMITFAFEEGCLGWGVVHKDGDKSNNALDNLEWDRNGRLLDFRLSGENHHFNRVPPETVAEIKRLKGEGLTNLQVSRRLGVDIGWVSRVYRGQARKSG